MRRPLIYLGVILVILVTAMTAQSVAAQYPCCYEPPYVLATYEGWNSQGQYVVWDYYSDGHWVGTCYAGCGYPYSYGYDLGAGASKPLTVSLVATLGRGAASADDVQYDWVDEGQGYHVTWHGWSEDGYAHWQNDCYSWGCTGWYLVDP